MAIENNAIVIVIGVLLTLILLIVSAIYYGLQNGFNTKLTKRIKELEQAIKSSEEPNRIILENEKIRNYFELLMILFINEYHDLEHPPKIDDVAFEGLVRAWVDKRTGTLTSNNVSEARDLASMITCTGRVENILNNYRKGYIYGDDLTFPFDGPNRSAVYLSKNDFIKDFIEYLTLYNPTKKLFFK